MLLSLPPTQKLPLHALPLLHTQSLSFVPDLSPEAERELYVCVPQPRMTMARTIKLYRLPSTTATPGLRAMEARDVPAVTALLNRHLEQFKLTQHFLEDEVAHW
jgi:glycylpeptide N-tetradecanoyltransferase